MGWDVGGGVEVDSGDDRDNSSSAASERDRDDYDEDHDDGRDPHTGERTYDSTYDREERERAQGDDGWDAGGGTYVGGSSSSSSSSSSSNSGSDSWSPHRDHDKESNNDRDDNPSSGSATRPSWGLAEGSGGTVSSGGSDPAPSKPAFDPNKIITDEVISLKRMVWGGKYYISPNGLRIIRYADGRTEIKDAVTGDLIQPSNSSTGSPNSGSGIGNAIGNPNGIDPNTNTQPNIDNSTSTAIDNTGTGTPTINLPKSSIDTATGVTQLACEPINLCLPDIHIPDSVMSLGSNEETSKESKKLLGDVLATADKIPLIPEANLSVNPTFPFPDDILELARQSPELAQYIQEYSDLSAFNQAPFPEHTFTEFDPESDKSMLDALAKLDDLLKEPTDIDERVGELSNDTLTERIVDGRGTFDWLSSAMLNQLDMARKKELVDKSDIANIYTQSMLGVLQTSSQFVLERDKTYWANLLVRSQMIQANVQALLAKAQLITLPIEVRLKYAQLHAQLQQLRLVGYQIESEKVRIKQTEAQTDQILAQTDGIRLQNELTQVNIQEGKIKLELAQEQVVQAREQTLSLVAQTKQTTAQTKQIKTQTEQTVEQTKLINSQWQKTLKEVKLVDANILEIEAKIRLMAQQTEKETNQIALVKGQVAEAYSRIALISEQIKAAKAQYSDTIDGKPVKGIIGTQNALHRKQSLSYDRDSLYKVMQLQSNGWQVKKTADIGTKSPAAFTAASLDGMLEQYLGTYYSTSDNPYVSLGGNQIRMPNGAGSTEVVGRVDINALKPVENYRDYVSDEEMDNPKVPTKVGNTGTN